MSTEVMTLRGTLEHHKGWITQVSCSPVHPDMLISASRDKTLLVWQLTGKDSNKNVPYAKGQKISWVIMGEIWISKFGPI